MSEIRRKLVMVGDGACGKVGLVWAQYQSIILIDSDVNLTQTSLALLLCTGVVQQVCVLSIRGMGIH
jgi:GTPase SAR1 family protein